MSLNIKVQDGRHLPITFFFCFEPYYPYYLLNCTRETRFRQYVFISGIVFCILTSLTIKIQDGRLRPYWKCNLRVNGHRNPCNITFPTKCGIESLFLALFLYCDVYKYQNSRWPLSINSIFCVLSHITHITCWITHEKLVFSNMCLFPDIISCILTSPNIKIQDGHQRTHFWNHLCILTGLNVKTQDGRHLSFPLFSDLSHSIHWSCWMSHQKFVSSNICWFYVLLLHIFPQWSPRKVEIDNFTFSNRKSIISSSIPLNWCHKMNCNDNDWCCKFINVYVYYVFICQCIILIDMLVYQDWIRT